MDFRGLTPSLIGQAIDEYGASPGAVATLRNEEIAANEAIETGVYVTFVPRSHDLIRDPTCRYKYESGSEQCCRVGRASRCSCGHSLSDHSDANPKSKSFIRPPKCKRANCRCFGFSYIPSQPEECGQWWLPRRKDFDLRAWRKRVIMHPDEYACIGCDLKLTDHETQFETRNHRLQRGAPVDAQFMPLNSNPELQSAVFAPPANSPSMYVRPRPP